MLLSSPAFRNNERIPRKYTCDGEGISPPLSIGGIPQGTRSLALIVDDPDAPRGTWVHWVLWNIKPCTGIPEGKAPEGSLQGINDSREIGYGGPCPPSGAHRYFFKLYALDCEVSLPLGSSKAKLEREMAGHITGKAELVGFYSRQA